MTFQSRRTVKATRKAAWCAYCGTAIPVGSEMIAEAQEFQGDFSYTKGHVQCVDLWSAIFHHIGCDNDDGMQWDLAEVLSQYDNWEAQDILDLHRGYFPHAVTRLEYRMRRFLEASE